MAADESEQSPWTRPGFVAAAVVVAVVLVLAAVLGVNALRQADSEEPPPPVETATGTPTPSETAATADESVCGLEGAKSESTLTIAPTATWQFQGSTAYPTSNEYGPGVTDDQGVRSCFQRSPEGALFMAANALVQGSDAATGATWAESALAEGEHRAELLKELGTPSDSSGTRLNIAGFRLLAFDGNSATVDMAVQGSAGGQGLTVSAVYELVWEGGDWKISADVREPLDVATIPDLAGYVPWGA
ncbi:hypothetical protein ICW40_07355 [Actinotalea ferrariae]|uniref:hypothetical protein n=1 Tax=Actinotalea ferrariae TaxID=1386098 RepID=UPI001C8B1765|nr:hypothetical protein [Actinotalea ferrariae]MBX9244625.1 hypothetical protein [Actinotalea ferrariae]